MSIKKLLLFLLQSLSICSFSQNVGIGTSTPYNKLDVAGSLLVNTPSTATSTPPTVAQTKTLPGLGTIPFLLFADSTGRLYDPGGPAGNYGIDLDSKATIVSSTNIAIELTAETMNLNTGDSLIIKTSSTGTVLLAVGNGYNTTGKWVFNSSALYINFKSNTDFNTGTGFSLLFKRLYDNSAALPEASGAIGNALFFDTKNGSFRSGLVNNALRGESSTAMGGGTTASAYRSTAMGSLTTASGLNSTAMGYETIASGYASTAMGQNTIANDFRATAMGWNTVANGFSSTAMGENTTASGSRSTSMGYFTTAMGNHSTAMGDNTNATGIASTAMGKYTDANGYASIAIGDSSLASGSVSFASGYRTSASGVNSTAMGLTTNASGANSTAMGQTTTASGFSSTAMGYVTTSGGYASTAMGLNTSAGGFSSTAMGSHTNASGDYSTAMGNHVSTNNQEGCFVIGDNSTITDMNSPAANNFRARFANGYRLYTSSNYSTSCSLGAGDNAWTTTSDMRLKENFETINGEDFLKKISTMQLVSWNYKKQDPSKFRHYGPMAQDFYAAFGKDKYGTIGNDTTINSADFAGVSFIAIQALEKRTQKIEQLEKENEELKRMLLQLKKEVDVLKGIKSEN